MTNHDTGSKTVDTPAEAVVLRDHNGDIGEFSSCRLVGDVHDSRPPPARLDIDLLTILDVRVPVVRRIGSPTCDHEFLDQDLMLERDLRLPDPVSHRHEDRTGRAVPPRSKLERSRFLGESSPVRVGHRDGPVDPDHA